MPDVLHAPDGTSLIKRDCKGSPSSRKDRAGASEVTPRPPISNASRAGARPSLQGDRRPPDRHESPVADQAIEHDARDDAPARVAEGGEAEHEAGLDRSPAPRKQRYHGDDLGDGVRGDQRAKGHVGADRSQRDVQGEAVQEPVDRREPGHSEVVRRTGPRSGRQSRPEHDDSDENARLEPCQARRPPRRARPRVRRDPRATRC